MKLKHTALRTTERCGGTKSTLGAYHNRQKSLRMLMCTEYILIHCAIILCCGLGVEIQHNSRHKLWNKGFKLALSKFNGSEKEDEHSLFYDMFKILQTKMVTVNKYRKE